MAHGTKRPQPPTLKLSVGGWGRSSCRPLKQS